MSTIDAYGVKFIGNDMVAPRVKRPQNVAPVQRHRFVSVTQPQAPVKAVPKVQPVQHALSVQQVAAVEEPVQEPELATYAESHKEPAKLRRQARTHRRLTISRRMVVVALSAVVVLGAAAYVIPHASSLTRSASKLTASINAKLHPAVQPSFTMPAHSVLVKTSILSNFTDAVESQSIVINIGTNTVTPLPNDIANWMKTSNGPEKGTTVLTANESAISSYVTNAVQNSVKTSPMLASSVTPSGESAAVNQITKELLKYNGVSVSVNS